MVAFLWSTVRKLALKIASYGAMHLVVAIAVAFAITQDIRMALAIGIVEPFFQTIAYTIHDRIWHVIEKRRLATGLEEAAEAVSSRLGVMSPEEQLRVHGHKHHHHGHSHALPRSLKQVALKTVTYGVMHFAVAVSVAFALTGNIRAALAIGIIEPLVQTVFFTIHDRIWTRIEAREQAQKAAAKTDASSHHVA
ncbi:MULTISPECIES: DUF2061 domain-containing protein [unclassified Brevundimonas]|uniref:DUF2061 domain-containing protein n=1 Tax=unclassified Brevundimonas TaxID=2622653 RepID=UPI0025C331F9|nr:MULTISPECIES: DUF2061 domain-containing protein [unclassified Brevundimonas]